MVCHPQPAQGHGPLESWGEGGVRAAAWPDALSPAPGAGVSAPGASSSCASCPSSCWHTWGRTTAFPLGEQPLFQRRAWRVQTHPSERVYTDAHLGIFSLSTFLRISKVHELNTHLKTVLAWDIWNIMLYIIPLL